MTVNELLRNSTIRRAHYIEMFKNNDVRRILLLLNAVDSDLQKQIFARAGKSYNMTSKRLELMQRDVKESVALGQQILSKSMNETALEFSKEEVNWTVNTLTKAVPSPVAPQFVYPSATQVLASIKATPYSNTTMQQFIKGWADNKLHRFNNALKLGFIQGKGVEDIARGLFGTRALQYTDGLANMSRREIRTGVRTAINHFSQTAREETYKANEEFVKGIQWVSTLDARTTLICIGLDGKIDLLDESVMELNGQRPPAHFNCRSTTVPVLKSLKELGLSEREFSTSTRASMNGQVSAKETYSTWFAKQDEKFQKSVLGKGRYELYKSGEIKLDGFADNGRTITLAQLGKTVKQEPTFTRNYSSDIAMSTGRGYYNEMRDIVDNCNNKNVANVWNKYEDTIKIGSTTLQKGAYYRGSNKRIYFNAADDASGNGWMNPYQTLFHEAGHSIDYKIGVEKKGTGAGFGIYSIDYKDGLFAKTIKDEVDSIVKDYMDIAKERIKAGDTTWMGRNGVSPANPKYPKALAYKKLENTIRMLKRDGVNLSDIVEGATKAKVQAGFGHGKSYWDSANFALSKEAFAEMFDANMANEDSLSTIKAFLPKSYALFEEMIKGVL